jgi:Cu/Ag efflux pump CusA
MDFLLRDDDHRDIEEIAGDLSKRIGRIPGISATVEGFLSERINEILSGQTAPVAVVVRGADLASLQNVSQQIASEMRKTPGLQSVRPDVGAQIPQLRIVPRAIDLGRFGLSVSGFAEQVATWRQGSVVTRLSGSNGRVVDVVVAGRPLLQQRAGLRDLPIRTPAGVTIRLGDVADIEQATEPAAIRHDSGERQIAIGADVRGTSVSAAVQSLQSRLDALALPPGMRVEVTGQSVARHAAAMRLLLIGAAVLVGIFILLLVALESFRDATIVLLNFPLGLIGGVFVAALAPDGLSVAGFVGFVTLFGIVARNGIMLVAHRQVLLTEAPHLTPEARTLRAAEERLLPIVMTAATAGLGLLPLALSILAAGSELESPMAIVVLGGLLTSTALNMVVLPTVYVYLDRRREEKTA